MDLHEMPLEGGQCHVIEGETRLVVQLAWIADAKKAAKAPVIGQPSHDQRRLPSCPQARTKPSEMPERSSGPVPSWILPKGGLLPRYSFKFYKHAASYLGTWPVLPVDATGVS